MSAGCQNVVLIAIRTRRGELEIRIRSDWRHIARPLDHEYLKSLFDDLKERVGFDPESLFTQLCSLGTGTVAVYKVGLALEESPELVQLFDQFQKI